MSRPFFCGVIFGVRVLVQQPASQRRGLEAIAAGSLLLAAAWVLWEITPEPPFRPTVNVIPEDLKALEYLATACEHHARETGRYPDRIEMLTRKHVPQGHDSVSVQWVDVWGTPLRYHPLREGRAFEIRSAGPDRQFETFDDLIRRGGDQPAEMRFGPGANLRR